jgi:hypothetical protein
MSKKSASPVNPSSLAREFNANDGTSRSTSQSHSRSPITPTGNGVPTQVNNNNGGKPSPPSEVGGNTGLLMSSIREERETSA